MPVIPNEVVGLDAAIDINGIPFIAQRLRIRVFGELGDLTSTGDFSKRRKGTVLDVEVSITQASFDNTQVYFADPANLTPFEYLELIYWPSGRNVGDFYSFPGLISRDITHELDVNMLQPFDLQLVQGDGQPFFLPGE